MSGRSWKKRRAIGGKAVLWCCPNRMADIDNERLGRKRPYSPPLITSTPIQSDPTTTAVEDSTVHAVRGVKEERAECEAGAPPPVKKRLDYLQWEEYFMAVAFLSAQRSKDPNSQVGACIVNSERKIVGIGYNGMPNRCSDDELPWQREADDKLDTKYPYVCHAEMNAILNKNSADVKGCTMYVALFPCNECAKLIIQSSIAEVVYVSDKYQDKPEMKASRRLLDMAGVKCRQYTPTRGTITIDFSSIGGSTYDVKPSASISFMDEEKHDKQ